MKEVYSIFGTDAIYSRRQVKKREMHKGSEINIQ